MGGNAGAVEEVAVDVVVDGMAVEVGRVAMTSAD